MTTKELFENLLLRAQKVKNDAGIIFSDYVAFVLVTIGSLDLGASAYVQKYFLQFDFYYSSWSPAYKYNKFITDILFHGELMKRFIYAFMIVLIFMVFAALYFCSRYIFQTWFGYLLLCFTTILLIISGTVCASYIGSRNAQYDIDNPYCQTRLINISVNTDKEQDPKPEIEEGLFLYRDRQSLYVYSYDSSRFLIIENQSINEIRKLKFECGGKGNT